MKVIDDTNYLDLNKYMNYLNDKQELKLVKKKTRKNKKGDDLKLNHRIAIHDVIEQNGTYVLNGKSHCPNYRTDYYTDANSVIQTRSIFDSYQYSHAVIIGFSQEEEILWNQTFKMNIHHKPFYVKRF